MGHDRAQHEDDDGVVREVRPQIVEQRAQQPRRRVERVRRVEQAVHACRVLAQEPQSEPVR
jgi:hypothetical protein